MAIKGKKLIAPKKTTIPTKAKKEITKKTTIAAKAKKTTSEVVSTACKTSSTTVVKSSTKSSNSLMINSMKNGIKKDQVVKAKHLSNGDVEQKTNKMTIKADER